jgi:galactonate dehydratase
MAKRLLRLLEPYGLLWAEEPVLPEYPEALAELARFSPVPLATGERLYSRWEFKDVVRSGVAVVQPDVAQAGGISETLRIASLADAYDVSVAIHCPLGPIALAASLQVDFAIPNALVQEQGVDYDWASEGLGAAGILDYLVDTSVFEYRDGYVARPTRPGLGIEIDERAVERAAATGHRHARTVHRHADGAFAEW